MVTFREEAAVPACPRHHPHPDTDTIPWSPQSACSGGCGVAEFVLQCTSVVCVNITVKYPAQFKTNLMFRIRTRVLGRKLKAVAYICDPNTWEVEVGRPEVLALFVYTGNARLA